MDTLPFNNVGTTVCNHRNIISMRVGAFLSNASKTCMSEEETQTGLCIKTTRLSHEINNLINTRWLLT